MLFFGTVMHVYDHFMGSMRENMYMQFYSIISNDYGRVTLYTVSTAVWSFTCMLNNYKAWYVYAHVCAHIRRCVDTCMYMLTCTYRFHTNLDSNNLKRHVYICKVENSYWIDWSFLTAKQTSSRIAITDHMYLVVVFFPYIYIGLGMVGWLTFLRGGRPPTSCFYSKLSDVRMGTQLSLGSRAGQWSDLRCWHVSGHTCAFLLACV